MNRPRILRALRIGWTAFCGIACLLLVVLWVRSYSQTWDNCDEFAGSIYGTRFSFSLEDGKLIFAAGRSRMYDVKTLIWANNHMRVLVPNGLVVANSSMGIAVWLWFWLAELLVAALPVLAWIQPSSRFNLRVLLLATTLSCLVFGAAMWALR
jgi:hypothetical protein